jgi:plasmid stabilization system protein ParE
MPRGDKSSYTDKQKRQAEHIEEGYEARGISGREAARRAWATVNKETHGGKKSGSGRGKPEDHAPSRKGGRLGGRLDGRASATGRRPLTLGQEGGRDPQATDSALTEVGSGPLSSLRHARHARLNCFRSSSLACCKIFSCPAGKFLPALLM